MDGHSFPLSFRRVGRGRKRSALLKKKLSVMLSFHAGNAPRNPHLSLPPLTFLSDPVCRGRIEFSPIDPRLSFGSCDRLFVTAPRVRSEETTRREDGLAPRTRPRQDRSRRFIPRGSAVASVGNLKVTPAPDLPDDIPVWFAF